MQFELLLLDTTACPACLWKIIGMFLAATLLGLLLGWILWGRYRRAMLEAEKERDNYKAKFTDMEKDHASLKYQLEEQGKEINSSRSALRSCEADKATLNAQLSRLRRQMEEGDGDSPSASSGTTVLGATGGGRVKSQTTGYGAIFASDNLQIVEGIGAKIEKILKDAGIADWGRLAAAQPDNLRSTLEAAGPSYRIHDPESWPKQAQMAKDGKWAELIAFQKSASGGKEDEGDGDTASKVEGLYAKALGFSTAKSDDLKIIEGIGPKIEELLKNGGIKTWADLAKASVNSIQAILDAAGDRYRLAKPDTWPKQAQYAVDGNWADLKAYQDELNGGK